MNVLPHVAAASSRVAVQRPADRSGNPHQRVQPRQPRLHGMRDHVGQQRATPGPQPVAVDTHLAERRVVQPQHDAAHPFVAHQKVRAPSQYPERHPLGVTSRRHRRRFLERPRTYEILRGAADPQPRVRSQRLIGRRDVFEFVEQGHGASGGCLPPQASSRARGPIPDRPLLTEHGQETAQSRRLFPAPAFDSPTSPPFPACVPPRLPCRENRRHHHPVRARPAPPRIPPATSACATPGAPETPPPQVAPKRPSPPLQHRPNFRRMMGIIVDQHRAGGLAQHLEPPSQSRKRPHRLSQPSRDLAIDRPPSRAFPRGQPPTPSRQHVAHIVRATQRRLDHPQQPSPRPHSNRSPLGAPPQLPRQNRPHQSAAGDVSDGCDSPNVTIRRARSATPAPRRHPPPESPASRPPEPAPRTRRTPSRFPPATRSSRNGLARSRGSPPHAAHDPESFSGTRNFRRQANPHRPPTHSARCVGTPPPHDHIRPLPQLFQHPPGKRRRRALAVRASHAHAPRSQHQPPEHLAV